VKKLLLTLALGVLSVAVQAQTYCTPSYSTGCNVGDDIDDVYIGNFSDTATGCTSSFYNVQASDTIFLQQTVPTSVSFTSNYSTQYFAIWVDFNDDGDFSDSGEHLWSSPTNVWSSTVGSITIPSTMSLGSYRLRIRSNYSSAITAAQSCSNFTYGECHDYTVSVTAPPACPAPVLASLIATDTTATITWTSNDTVFNVDYNVMGSSAVPITVTVYDTTATITGLSPNTWYEFYLETDCSSAGNGYSTTIGPYSVKTLCSPLSTPVYEGFDNDSVGSFSNPNAPSCWYYVEESGAAGYGYINNATWSISPLSNSNYYYLYNSFDADYEALVSPAIVGLDSGTKQMELWLANTGWSVGNDVYIGTVSSPSSLSSLSIFDTLSVPNGATWTKFTVYFDSVMGYNMVDDHIAIVTSDASTYSAVYIEDILISNAPPCLPPSAIGLGTVLKDSVQISYSTSGIATWLEYGPVGFVQGTGTQVQVSGSPTWLTGLDSNTSYDVYVIQMCSDSTISPGFGPVSFKTMSCSPSNMCSFDIELTDSYGDGWNGGEVQVLNSNGGVEYTLGTNFTTGSSYTETIALCSGGSYTIEVSDEGGWPSEMGLNVVTNGGTVATYAASSSTVLGTQMASFQSNCNAQCPPPTAIGAGTVSTDSVEISYTASGIAVWLEYGPAGFTQGTGTQVQVSGSPAWLTGLDSSTSYDVYVIQMCSDSSISSGFGPVSFTTLSCSPSYMCSFDIELTDSYGDGWNGGEVQVLNSNGGVEYTLGTNFTTGSSYTETIALCSGGSYTIEVSDEGGWPSEMGLNVVTNGGTIATYTASSSTVLGTQMASFQSNCNVLCPAPTNLTYNAGKNDVAFSFDSNGGSGTYIYSWGPTGFLQATGAGVNYNTDSTTATGFSVSGLSSNTCYDIIIIQNCGVNGSSDTLGPVNFCTGMCDTTDLCDFTMSMYDTYGDGWNGATVDLYYNGVYGTTLGSNFTSGDSMIVSLQICAGTEIVVVNASQGSWPSEVYYDLTGPNSQSVSVSSGSFTAGVVDTLYSNCTTPSCATPSNLGVATMGSTFADISWTGGNGTFIYHYTASGSANTMMGTSTSAMASMTGLAPVTTYFFDVAEVCAPGDTSLKMHYTFTTDSCYAISVGNPNYSIDSIGISFADITFTWGGASGYTSYFINFGDGSNATGTGSTHSHSYTANGQYTAVLKLYGDCDTTSQQIFVNIQGIGLEEKAAQSILMYPNPTSGLIHISGTAEQGEEVQMRVMNYMGQELFNTTITTTNGTFEKDFDLGGYSSGTYLVEIRTINGMIQRPFVVRH